MLERLKKALGPIGEDTDGKVKAVLVREISALVAERDRLQGLVIASPAECSPSCDDAHCPYTHVDVTWEERAQRAEAEARELATALEDMTALKDFHAERSAEHGRMEEYYRLRSRHWCQKFVDEQNHIVRTYIPRVQRAEASLKQAQGDLDVARAHLEEAGKDLLNERRRAEAAEALLLGRTHPCAPMDSLAGDVLEWKARAEMAEKALAEKDMALDFYADHLSWPNNAWCQPMMVDAQEPDNHRPIGRKRPSDMLLADQGNLARRARNKGGAQAFPEGRPEMGTGVEEESQS